MGYFSVDYDTDVANGKLVFNRTVTLKETDKSKAMAEVEGKKARSNNPNKDKKKKEKETKKEWNQ